MNEKLKIGDKAPLFSLPDKDGNLISLEDFKGKKVVLYFYPRDNTPGCTKEAEGFTEMVGDFEKKGAVILGISPDSEKSHARFIEKKNLKITLLSDKNHEVLESYGVWRPKKMMGREFLGVVRSTFLINEDGFVEKIWDKVRVKGHVEDVFKSI